MRYIHCENKGIVYALKNRLKELGWFDKTVNVIKNEKGFLIPILPSAIENEAEPLKKLSAFKDISIVEVDTPASKPE